MVMKALFALTYLFQWLKCKNRKKQKRISTS